MNKIIQRLKVKKRKGIAIVKESQIRSYCKEFSLNFKEATLVLLNTGVIGKYSKNGSGYPYRFKG